MNPGAGGFVLRPPPYMPSLLDSRKAYDIEIKHLKPPNQERPLFFKKKLKQVSVVYLKYIHLTQEFTRVTSQTGRIFLISRVPLKSKAKYQSVTSQISYLSVSLSTLPEHNSYCSASLVSTRFNNFHANNKSYCPVFHLWRI